MTNSTGQSARIIRAYLLQRAGGRGQLSAESLPPSPLHSHMQGLRNKHWKQLSGARTLNPRLRYCEVLIRQTSAVESSQRDCRDIARSPALMPALGAQLAGAPALNQLCKERQVVGLHPAPEHRSQKSKGEACQMLCFSASKQANNR